MSLFNVFEISSSAIAAQSQRLNVTAFLMSGVTASAGAQAIGEPYRDADGREYLPLLVQPILVWAASVAIGLEPLATAVTVITAGQPTGANAFFLARRTGVSAAASAGAVVVSTILAVFTLSALLAWLR